MSIFRTVDSVLCDHNGEEVTVLEPLSPDLYNAEEVGPMFRVRFQDGSEAEAFADEVS